jgi:hypothetical protein
MRSQPGVALLDLPEDLSRQAGDLLDAQREDALRGAMRRAARKRFASGVVAAEDLTGFYVDGRPVTEKDLSAMEKVPAPDWDLPGGAVGGLTSAASQQLRADLVGEDRWRELADKILLHFYALMATEAGRRAVQDMYAFSPELPDWMTTTFVTQGLGAPPSLQVGPFVKHSDQYTDQHEFLKKLRSHQPTLARYFVPMTGFRLAKDRPGKPSECICIMPYMQNFLTLHEWFRRALVEPKSSPQRQEKLAELRQVVPAVVAELGKILSLEAVDSWDGPAPAECLMKKLKKAFLSPLPVLLGSQLLEAYKAKAKECLDRKAGQLLAGQGPREDCWGHGDLNATNILVGVRRGSSQQIEEVCVRLIDPNPATQVRHPAFDLGRLIHWIELGVPLACRAGFPRTTESSFSLHFRRPAGDDDRHFLDCPPDLQLDPEITETLGELYRSMLDELERGLPWLREDAGRRKLSLATASFHLIGARYWKQAAQRTAAFLSALGEITFLEGGGSPSGLPGPFAGLGAIRHRMHSGGRAMPPRASYGQS